MRGSNTRTHNRLVSGKAPLLELSTGRSAVDSSGSPTVSWTWRSRAEIKSCRATALQNRSRHETLLEPKIPSFKLKDFLDKYPGNNLDITSNVSPLRVKKRSWSYTITEQLTSYKKMIPIVTRQNKTTRECKAWHSACQIARSSPVPSSHNHLVATTTSPIIHWSTKPSHHIHN